MEDNIKIAIKKAVEDNILDLYNTEITTEVWTEILKLSNLELLYFYQCKFPNIQNNI